MAVLSEMHEREDSERAGAAGLGARFGKEGVIARLLCSHPDVHTRLHHLETHLRARGERGR
jgi:hypothetical protein